MSFMTWEVSSYFEATFSKWELVSKANLVVEEVVVGWDGDAMFTVRVMVDGYRER